MAAQLDQIKKMLEEDMRALEVTEKYHLRKLEEVQSKLKMMRKSYKELEEKELIKS